MQITLTATNTLPADPNQNLLLFLLPKNASSNFQLDAWQVLNPGPNNGTSTISFAFDTAVVASTTQGPNQTAQTGISLGQVLGVYSDSVNALRFDSSPNDAKRVTCQQSGVVNNTNSMLISTKWLINGQPVVQVPEVNQGQIVTFEFEPTIYVMAASPTLQGKVGAFAFTVQEISNLTSYEIPAGSTNVALSWSRAANSMGGIDIFSFSAS